MNRKRSLVPDVYRLKKRTCTTPQKEAVSWEEDTLETTLPSDTKAALLYLKSLFPVEKFDDRLPPMILKHQLYSVIHNRTAADKELEDLRTSGEIKMFKLGSEASEFCIVFTTDYTQHVLKAASETGVSKCVIDKFLSTVVNKCHDVSLNKHTVMGDFKFKDEEITQLVKASTMTVRDVGSWWLAVPGTGIFMKSYLRGRKAILTMIKKCKYKEILQKDLEVRKLPRIARLGMQYHIHDLIGADIVECIRTTSGQLLRLSEC